MNSAEKAKELVSKYRKFECKSTRTGVEYIRHLDFEEAKVCAIICADTIIEHIQGRVQMLHDTTDVSDLDDWKKIRAQIPKL